MKRESWLSRVTALLPRRGYCVEVFKICVRPVSVRVCLSVSVCPSVATLFGPGIWFLHDWYWTVRGSKKWSKLCKSTKMDHEFGSFTTGIGRFEVQKWVRNSHNRHFGATLPCGCYLVIPKNKRSKWKANHRAKVLQIRDFTSKSLWGGRVP